MKTFYPNPYAVLSYWDQILLQEEIDQTPIEFIFDKLNAEQFVKVRDRVEKVEGLYEGNWFISRGVFKISFSTQRDNREAISIIDSLAREIYPERFKNKRPL